MVAGRAAPDILTWRERMTALFSRFVREETGQGLIEYLLLGTLIAIVVVIGATLMGVNP